MLIPFACVAEELPEEAVAPPPPGVQATLSDGTVLVGEPLATLDRRRWWLPARGLVHLMFDATAVGVYPNDRRVRVALSRDVASAQAVALDPATPSWQDHLIQRGVVLAQMPLDVPGPVWVLRANDGYHLGEGGYGTFAWDLSLTDAAGARFSAAGTANTDYFVWQVPVVLPLGGVVTEVVRNEPDHGPGVIPAGAVNNMVGVRVDGQLALYVLHLAQGSVPANVQPGVVLPAGAFVGTVGMSGVTLEPHLHIVLHFLDLAPGPTGVMRTWSVPVTWSGVWTSSAPTGPGVWQDVAVPGTGVWMDDAAF